MWWDMTSYYYWWLRLIVANDMEFIQWGTRLLLMPFFFMKLLIIVTFTLQRVSNLMELSGYFDHQDFHVFSVLCGFLCLTSFANILHVFLSRCSWNTCNYNYSWQATINLKISYYKIFHAYFNVHALTVHLEWARRASWCKGALRKAKGLKGKGFRASACTHVLKRERKTRWGTLCKSEGWMKRLWAS